MLLEAAAFLFVARLAVAALPFRLLAPALGRAGGATAEDLPAAARRGAHRVAWAVEAATRRSPFAVACLPQALAARWMLRRRGVPATLYLGLRRDADRELLAHAWLRAGRLVVTGGSGDRGYTRLASFA